MQRLSLFNCKACCGFENHLDEQRSLRDFAFASMIHSPIRREHGVWFMMEKVRPIGATYRFLQFGKINGLVEENQGELVDEEEDDDDLCPVDCVREFKTDEEFLQILEKAKETNSLVVVDFYRTSCGSCKYIEQGFSKLCKGSGDQEAPVIFLKHNVIDEYDEESEVADRLRIRAVPLFHFYKNGVLLEAFPTRDKKRITEVILKYTTPSPQ